MANYSLGAPTIEEALCPLVTTLKVGDTFSYTNITPTNPYPGFTNNFTGTIKNIYPATCTIIYNRADYGTLNQSVVCTGCTTTTTTTTTTTKAPTTTTTTASPTTAAPTTAAPTTAAPTTKAPTTAAPSTPPSTPSQNDFIDQQTVKALANFSEDIKNLSMAPDVVEQTVLTLDNTAERIYLVSPSIKKPEIELHHTRKIKDMMQKNDLRMDDVINDYSSL